MDKDTQATLTAGMQMPSIEPGWVWLVGAGPGDPGLLTLLGAGALQSADVVVYDALVDPRIVALVRPETERVYAGKRGTRTEIVKAAVAVKAAGNDGVKTYADYRDLLSDGAAAGEGAPMREDRRDGA